MSHTRTTCVISLGLTIMDRCPECDRIDRAAEEAERVARAQAFAEANKWKPPPPPSVSRDGGKTWQQTTIATSADVVDHVDIGNSLPSESARSAARLARTVGSLRTKELAAYSHAASSSIVCNCEAHADSVFFVSCIEDEGQRRHSLLLGPYDTHEEALANVERGRKLAVENDPKAHWYHFGTCSIQEPTEKKGVFGK